MQFSQARNAVYKFQQIVVAALEFDNGARDFIIINVRSVGSKRLDNTGLVGIV